jgi:hypothetical protein
MDPLQRPPVNGAAVVLAVDDLRCQVLCVPMNDMDHVSIDSVLNSTAVGPPASPVSLLDDFRLRRDRMHEMKAVEQEEEGRLGAGGKRSSPVKESLAPAMESPAPTALIATRRRPRRPPDDNDDAAAVAGDLPTTNMRERERESGFVWVSVCGQGHIRER